MGILTTLRQAKTGEWGSLPDYLRELRHRETGALGALAHALSATPEEQIELGQTDGAGPVLLEVACDLRMPKGARLAATRCLVEAGIEPPHIGYLFIGAGDLVTDPRMGNSARKLVEGGLPAAVELGGEAALVTMEAGAFARAVQAAASTVGQPRLKELLAHTPEGHAGARAGLFALGQAELTEGHRAQWEKLLEETCAKHRRAPAAARRMGLAPPWPPNLPDAFAPMVQQAEKKNEGVAAADAAANPSALKKKPGAVGPPQPPEKPVAKPAPSSGGRAPPIRQSAFRRPIGTVMEVPRTRLPPKPMEEVKARPRPSQALPEPQPHVAARDEAGGAGQVSPLEGMGPLPRRDQPDIRFDRLGNRIPRSDRWETENWEWQAPVLPSSELPLPAKAAVASGPFTQRLQSLFDDRPEAVERLCAAAEARAAIRGDEAMLRELGEELSHKRWKDRRAPPEQLARLRAVVSADGHPAPWKAVADYLLQRFSVPGAAAGRSG